MHGTVQCPLRKEGKSYGIKPELAENEGSVWMFATHSFALLLELKSVALWGPWRQFSISVSLVALSLPTLSRAQLYCIRGTCYPHQQNHWYNVDCLWRSTLDWRWNCGWFWGLCKARAAETRVLLVCSSSWFVWSGIQFPGYTFDDSVQKFRTSPCISCQLCSS